ncbi:hypothetical protein GGI04_002713 [Coemansia thaxteri]|uniref:AB hydrolase-1 domain-containing protein n=1 Tax=Coemansia thaxteri TaxID=2663907 RepID=A0A9W8EGX9_9FUNG|nr:hypothetical protein H4R26_005098 [Coemansia thaxteri]KAJ2004116.1 hypothetical protein GGI04_002713 [Coemansia thaxteri]KAJ2470633.1 hypothetical protein GGI02_002805 [Coemansia sp. RSA 2322]KAJ2476440.1 hypothetical protein EV174_004930 [Coemansia sp. RSA 2320]
MPGGNVQTIYLSTRHSKPAGCPVEYEREIFEFADGGKAAIDWSKPTQSINPELPLVVLISGLGGGSYNYFVRSFVHLVNQPPYGYQVAVLHCRGCNGVKLATPMTFHSGMTEDLREFMNHVRQTRPATTTIGIGFSLGANILTKYMGEEGENCPFAAAVSVCNPFDIDATLNKMSKFSIKNRCLYAAALTKKLVRGFVQNKDVIMAGPVYLDAQMIEASRTMNQFNETFAAKIFGYPSAKELNDSGSSARYLKDIKVPTLFINSLNDPICYKSTIPYKDIEANPYLLLACTRYGGHLAYFEGLDMKPWLPRQLTQFIQAALKW